MKKELPQVPIEKVEPICANCGKQFSESDFAMMARAIMGHQPACSYDCNKALGQVFQ